MNLFSQDVRTLEVAIRKRVLLLSIDQRELAYCGDNTEVAVYLDEMTRRLVLQMAVHHAQSHSDAVEETWLWPKTWWDHFKRDTLSRTRLGRWLKRKSRRLRHHESVRIAVKVTRHIHSCPHLHIPPDCKRRGLHAHYLLNVDAATREMAEENRRMRWTLERIKNIEPQYKSEIERLLSVDRQHGF